MISAILGALLVGIVIGALGRLVLPGKQDMSLVATLGVGVVAALLGTVIAALLGVSSTPGVDWIQLVLQIALAAAGVAILTRGAVRR